MADCSGDWTDSTIHWKRKNGTVHNPPLKLDDGDFTIDPHPGNTKFSGKHHDPQGNESDFEETRCTDVDANTFEIRMKRKDKTTAFPHENYIYKGTAVVDPVTGEAFITGTVRVTGPPTGGDVGTWESTRPGGGGEEDEKDKKDKKDGEDKDRDAGGSTAR